MLKYLSIFLITHSKQFFLIRLLTCCTFFIRVIGLKEWIFWLICDSASAIFLKAYRLSCPDTGPLGTEESLYLYARREGTEGGWLQRRSGSILTGCHLISSSWIEHLSIGNGSKKQQTADVYCLHYQTNRRDQARINTVIRVKR